MSIASSIESKQEIHEDAASITTSPNDQAECRSSSESSTVPSIKKKEKKVKMHRKKYQPLPYWKSTTFWDHAMTVGDGDIWVERRYFNRNMEPISYFCSFSDPTKCQLLEPPSGASVVVYQEYWNGTQFRHERSSASTAATAREADPNNQESGPAPLPQIPSELIAFARTHLTVEEINAMSMPPRDHALARRVTYYYVQLWWHQGSQYVKQCRERRQMRREHANLEKSRTDDDTSSFQTVRLMI